MKNESADFLKDAQWQEPLVSAVNKHPILTSFDERFVNFGSCFAQNMQSILYRYFFDVYFERDICAHYTIRSLCDILNTIVEKKSFSLEDTYAMNQEKTDIISSRFFNIRKFGKEAQTEAVNRMNFLATELVNKLIKADHICITLGTNYYYEHRDTKHCITRFGGMPITMGSVKTQSVEEVYNDLNQVRDIILKLRNNKPFNMIITVSPQRYNWTTAINDLPFLQHNTCSKSTLILASQEFSKNNKNNKVIYFPAYEMVIDELRLYETLSTYDHLHINQELTPKYVMKRFLQSYSKESLFEFYSLIDDMRSLYGETKFRLLNGALPSSEFVKPDWEQLMRRIKKGDQTINFDKLKKYINEKFIEFNCIEEYSDLINRYNF